MQNTTFTTDKTLQKQRKQIIKILLPFKTCPSFEGIEFVYLNTGEVIPVKQRILIKGKKTEKTGLRYYFFPEFQNELFPSSSQLTLPNNLSEDETVVKLKHYFPSFKNQSNGIVKTTNVQELITLTWIAMWCACFSHQKENEKLFRVEQLLDVLDRLYEKKCQPQVSFSYF